MAEFRSYAREGQLGRPIQAPNKAKAKHNRGRKFIQALKEEDVRTSQRDQQFLAAYKERLAIEKDARQAVENSKRESIEAERRQRVANAKLAADFAEQEANVNNARLQQLAELIPSIGKNIATALEKRKEFDKQQAFNAIAATGQTPQEIRAAIKLQLTTDEYAASTHASILRLRNKGITSSQYNQLARRDSAYGSALAQFEVLKSAGSFTPFLASQMNEELSDGTLVRDVFESTTLPNNNRRAYGREIVERFKQYSGLSNYNQSFIDSVLKGKDEAQYNAMYVQLAEKQEVQAHEAMVANETNAVVGDIVAGNFQTKVDSLAKNESTLNAHLFFKERIPYIVKSILNGKLGEEYYDQLLNLHSFDQKGNRVVRPELKNQIQDAINKRRLSELNQGRLGLREIELKNDLVIAQIEEEFIGRSPEEQQGVIETYLSDESLPFAVRSRLHSYSAKLHDWNRSNSIQAEKFVQEEFERTGVPLSIQELKERGLTGSQLTKWAEVYTKWQKSGDKPLFDGFKSEMTGKYRALVKSQPMSDHPYQHRIITALMNDYSKSYNANRAHMPQAQADEIARKYVQDRWEAGTADLDENKRTGPYRFVAGDTPMDATFPEFDSSKGSTQPKVKSVASAFEQHGSNFVNIPNSLWSNDTMNVIELTTHSSQVPSHVIQHAQDALAVTPEKDTWQGVLRTQMEASKIKPPAWLIEQTDAQTELFNQTPDRPSLSRTLEHAHKHGEPEEVTKERVRRAAGIEHTSAPSTTPDPTFNQGIYVDPHKGGGLYDNMVFDKNFNPRVASQYRVVASNQAAAYGGRDYGEKRPQGHNHSGEDIAMPTGTQIIMKQGGVVIESTFGPVAGNSVYIKHDDGTLTRYLHLDKRFVQTGTRISANQVIGTVGNTGRSYGSHLHFEVYASGGLPGGDIRDPNVFGMDQYYEFGVNGSGSLAGVI